MSTSSLPSRPSRPSQPKIPATVDAPRLFTRAEGVFAGYFALEELVAANALRALFRARHAVLKRQVALRVHLEPQGAGRAWFVRESELLARVDHPGVRPVFSAGFRDEWAYRVSKWIEGESLAEAVERGPRPLQAVLQMARDLISALETMHSEGIVVRRITPESLMLDRTGRAVITDLRWANRCLDVADMPAATDDALPFLAPEVRGGAVGEPASDVYTAGALLYFAVTGVPPATRGDQVTAPCVLRPSCPKALERVILRALCDDPGDRYLTAHEMGDDLVSDLGDLEFHTNVLPAAVDDAVQIEKRLRRSFGDDYELLHELGAGGFGRVYLVRDLALEREVALKVLHAGLTANPGIVERFLREARFAASLSHPHIVDVYDTGGRGGFIWYAMAYIPGENLAQYVRRSGPLPVDRAVALLDESLSALQHAHHRGLVHRDLKPENVLIEQNTDKTLITDFGLALAVEAGERSRKHSRSGTPEFAAPEQLLGEAVDLRTDLYSLALVGMFALTGQPPFGVGTLEAILARQTAGLLPDIRATRADAPPELVRVLVRAADRDPDTRYPSADLFRQDLHSAMRRSRLNPWPRLRRLFPF